MTVAIAAVGPLWVVYDRWLGLRRSGRYLSGLAGRFPFLEKFDLPDYAVVIAAAFLVLLVLARFRAADVLPLWRSRLAFARRPRRPARAGAARAGATAAAWAGGAAAAILLVRLIATRQQPGAELLLALCVFAAGMLLREVSVGALLRLWRRQRAGLLSILGAHVAVILALAAHYSYRRFELPLAALALLAVIHLGTRIRKTGPMPLIVLGFVVLYCWNINAWWYVLVGDEYRNFDIAAGIVRNHDASFIARNLFQLDGGLEGLDPYVDSLLQAASMRLLGVNSFGWRFSSLYFAAIALVFFHRFFRTFLTRRAALVTTICLGASHYVMSFFKIGYDKSQAYLAMSFLLATTACAVRTRRMIAFTSIGLAAALCFYVYPAALYIVPFSFFLLLLYAPPIDRATAARWGVALLTASLTIFPLPFQPTYFEGKRPGTVFYNSELASSASTLLPHFARNVALAAYSPFLLGSEDHFVTSSYLDPLTGLLFLVGMASALWLVRKDAFVAFLTVGLAWLLFFAGATHDRDFPPTTRMFLMLPVLLPIAILGLARLSALSRDAGLGARGIGGLGRATVAGVLALNILQSHVVSKRRSDNYELFDPLIVRLARRLETLPGPGWYLLLLAETPGESSGIPMVLDAYSLRRSDLVEIATPRGSLPPADRARVADSKSAVFVSTRLPPEERQSLEQQIAEAGKAPCSVRTSTGEERFKLWTAPGTPDLCSD